MLGDRVILQSGSVIGGDGFGYITQNGKHSKVLQTGNVVLQDDVEIGNNTCIDRATVDSTIVGKGTKIDNLVHLGHNDILGENCLVVAHVGISGSVTVGNNYLCWPGWYCRSYYHWQQLRIWWQNRYYQQCS